MSEISPLSKILELFSSIIIVGEKSFEWGSHYTFLKSDEQRGISHGDMIDLNRENFEGFDVREFYVNLVSDLKKQGY